MQMTTSYIYPMSQGDDELGAPSLVMKCQQGVWTAEENRLLWVHRLTRDNALNSTTIAANEATHVLELEHATGWSSRKSTLAPLLASASGILDPHSSEAAVL